MNALKHQIESLRPAIERPSPWSAPKALYSSEPFGLSRRSPSPSSIDAKGGYCDEVETTTLFLIGAECPFRCSMCDLWQFTSREKTPVGAIPFQLSQVLPHSSSSKRQWLKLYNASNFFDDRSVPKEDLAAIAKFCAPYERVIVENHPRFCDDRMQWFAQNIEGQLEVAMGLETIEPNAMQAMNKGMTLNDFDRAVQCCQRLQIDVRVFVLLHPPGIERNVSTEWTCRTVAYALDRGVRHISIIPVRSGNGWIDRLVDAGHYQIPTLSMVRDLLHGMQEHVGQIANASWIEFDLWGWDQIPGGCPRCRAALKEHLMRCHRTQSFLPWEENGIDCECTV